jgi:hypothetical protein
MRHFSGIVFDRYPHFLMTGCSLSQPLTTPLYTAYPMHTPVSFVTVAHSLVVYALFSIQEWNPMKNQRHQPPTSTTSVQLPLIGSVGIYTRVAAPDTLQQKGTDQVDGLKRLALELGFQEDQITVFEDNGMSGSIPLSQRGSNLLAAIKQGTTNTVLVSDVTRLFQDADSYQVNYFIQMCLEQNVLVVTPHCVYDFHNEALVNQFRVACLEAFRVLEEARTNMRRRKKGKQVKK